MEKEVPLEKKIITQEAVFDFSKLYKDMKEWFDKRQYVFHETAHEQKEEAAGTKLEIQWGAEREITNYFKFKIKIMIFGIEMEKLQTEEGNIVYQGNIKIIIDGTLIMDYKDKFKDSKFLELIQKVYNDTLIKKKIELYIIKLSKETEEIRELIKEHLQLY